MFKRWRAKKRNKQIKSVSLTVTPVRLYRRRIAAQPLSPA